MTPTHILIDKKELDKIIYSNNSHDEVVVKILALINKGKQISLDEKDIKEKATKSSIENCQFAYPKIERAKFKKGYKQALKDLL